ncbi:MAG: ABC transporter substrate-binding protein [Solirubrobacteraceae bacterium]
MTVNFRRAGAGALAAFVSVVFIAACGSSEKKTSESKGKGSSATAEVSNKSSSKPTLIVYSAQGYSPDSVKEFEKQTGTPAKLVENSTGPLLSRIQAEKSNPQWGLLWVDGPEAFARLDEEGQLVKNLKEPEFNSTGQPLVPKDHSFVPTGVTLGCAMIYNSKEVKAPPREWQELTQSKYAGKVGMNNPAISGPTYPCIAGVMNLLGGVPKGEAFFEKLKGEGLHVSETNGATLHLLETGQIQIGLIQSSAAVGAQPKITGSKVAFLPKEAILPSVIGVDAKAPAAVREEAQEFIDWVFSPAGQKVMKDAEPEGDSLFWPTSVNGTPLSQLPPLSGISTQTVEPYEWGKREASINSWFSSHIAQ